MKRHIVLLTAISIAIAAGITMYTVGRPDWTTVDEPLVQRPTPVHYRYIPNYIPVSPFKREMNGRFGPDMRELRRAIIARTHESGEPVCAMQILTEAHTLINYTNDNDAVRSRLADLRAALDTPPPIDPFQQSAEDGSWGGCFKAWYLRMHASVDPLKELVQAGRKPQYPLSFLAPVDSPEKLRARLHDLLVSDLPRTGVDNRKELNLTITGLAQLLFIPELAAQLPASMPVAAMAHTLQDFLDNTAQDHETGFWGAWYVVDGEIRKTNDLSITFHAISYRDSDPPRMKELADTLFAIRTRRYPYGWRDQGTQNNHHAYDVARLLRRAWPHMTAEQRIRSAAELTIMVARSLNVSINADGSFDVTPYDSASEAYYFGVSFLDEVGFFRPSRRFWTPLEISDPESLRAVLHKQLMKQDQRNAMIAAALRKLEARD
ncbi:MAG: hypothetical protein ACK4FK_11970 [Ferrovibrio sp.]|uniref:hypothetical protein n=1 Tax=Ferrovibrio sp. TaxID=1917215 RepID=UPI00391D6FE0